MTPIPNQATALRLQNARSVLLAALQQWPCSKPELAMRTGLTQMTIGKVVDQLLSLGCFVRAGDALVSGQGRPPLRVAPNPACDLVGIELGVRRTVVYRFGLGGAAGPQQHWQLPAHASLDALRGELRRCREPRAPAPRAVMVTVPGVLDVESGAVVYSPNLHWTEGRELLAGLAQDFAAPVHAVHEAQAQALGHLGCPEAADHFLLVDLGDGVGCAAVADGYLQAGPSPLRGEIGHTAVPGNLRRCGCGAQGCIETLAGRAGLLRSFREASGQHGADWDEMQRTLQDLDLPPWLTATLDALSMVVAGALNLLGYANVVFVGELTTLHAQVMPTLCDGLARHSLLGRFGRVGCSAAAPRRQFGLLAAAVDRVYLPAAAAAVPRSGGARSAARIRPARTPGG